MGNEKSSEAADPSGEPSRNAKLRARVGAGVKLSFYIHLAAYFSVNLLLAFINLLTTPLIWWVVWPLMGWGFALLIHALVAFLLPDLFGARSRLYEKELARQKGR